MASSASILSKALVHVNATPPTGSISHPYYMDISYDQDTFHCKLFTNARSADSDKKLFVYLILDATNVQAISLGGNDEVPPGVAEEYLRQARCTAAADLVSLQVTLTRNVSIVIPDLALQYKPSSVEDIATLLQLGQCQTFTIYVPSEVVTQERLSNLCDALNHCVIKPADRVIKTLYAGAGYKIVTHVDEIWSPDPPIDLSTAQGVSNDNTTSLPEPKSSSSPRGQGKRRSVSPGMLQNPSKRQAVTEKVAAQPWELAIAAQAAQIAALSVELSALRDQVQQLQRAPGVDAETQTDAVVEHELMVPRDADLPEVSLSQASTVENPIHDELFLGVYTDSQIDRMLDFEPMVPMDADLPEVTLSQVSTVEDPIHDEQAPDVYTDTQLDRILEDELTVAMDADLSGVTHSQVSTVEIPTHDQAMMFGETSDEQCEGNFEYFFDNKVEERLSTLENDMVNQSTFRSKLEERLMAKLDDSNTQLQDFKTLHELVTNGLEVVIHALATHIDNVEIAFGEKVEEAIEKQRLHLECKMDDDIEQKLLNAEATVKQDVRDALENGKVTFDFKFGWADTSESRC